MAQPSSSRAGPQRSASALAAHRASPYSSRSSSAGPLSDNLTFIRTLLKEIAASQDLNSDVFPPPTDHELRNLSPGETIIIPIVGAVLANLIETSSKVDRLTAAVDALTSPVLQHNEAIASLQASVRDLSQRVMASATARPSQATAQPPPPARSAHANQRQPPRPHQAAADKPATSSPGQFDTDCPLYDTTTHKWHGNPAAYAAKHPRSYEAQMWRDGKYPDITKFLSPAPAAPGQPGPSSRPIYANVAAPNPGRPKKKNKGKSVATAAQVAASSSSVAPEKGTAALPAAARRFIAPRASPLPHQDPLRIAATARDIAASVLREANCPFPLGFTASVNPRGSLTLTSTNLHTPATAFAPFYEALTNKLNQSFPI